MEENEIKELKKIITDYKIVKDRVRSNLNDIENSFSAGEITVWTRDLYIEDLYIGLDTSPERKLFKEQVKRTSDKNFEKYFRAYFSQIFLNRNINPENL